MTTKISFGTSGHRGIIGDTFTTDHIQAIAISIAQLLKPNASIIIGYDPREGNSPNLEEGSFTEVLVSTLRNNDINALFCDDYTPTPLISWAIQDKQLDGGLILTASHNPPEYNGIKFNPSNGAPAPTETTKKIQDIANSLTLPAHTPNTSCQTINLTKAFATHIHTLVGDLSGDIAIDTKFGACAKTWEALSATCGFNAHILNAEPRSDFGDIEPNPTHYDTLKKLRNLIISNSYPIGIANDPDGDRHVILDEKGNVLIPEETTAIIADHFKDSVTAIATTVASSQLIKSVCDTNNITYYETPVGFKYFADYLENEKLCLAVESSGGFSMSTHTREKCGFLPGLLLLSISQKTDLPISKLKENVLKKYGTFTFVETSIKVDTSKKEALNNEVISKAFPELLDINTTDGIKIILPNNSWVLCRFSGTEPVARIYSESPDPNHAKDINTHAQNLLQRLL